MSVLKRAGPTVISYAAYVFVLLAFVALGLTVAALASGSALAAILGASIVVLLAAAVAGFRLAARKLDEAREPGNPGGTSIWAKPLVRTQIDTYRLMYRKQEQEREEPAPQPAEVDLRAAA